MRQFLSMLNGANQAQAKIQKRTRSSRSDICLPWGFLRTLDFVFLSPFFFFMSKLWRMQWHAEAKWSGYNGAEMLNGGWGRLRVTGWRRSNKHKPCILLFATTMISTDGFIYLQVVCVSLSSHCVLFGLTLMRLSRGSLLCVCSNHWSVQTEFIVSLVIATGPDYVLYWPTLRLTIFFLHLLLI